MPTSPRRATAFRHPGCPAPGDREWPTGCWRRPPRSRPASRCPISPACRSYPTSSTASPTTARWGSNPILKPGPRRTTTRTTRGSSPTSCCPRSRGSTRPAWSAVTQEWQDYIDHIRAYGYNGVIVSGFLEYVNFDKVGDGYQVYPEDSPYRARHEAMVEQFGQMWQYADQMGMRLVFKTDMLANTGPLNDYVAARTRRLQCRRPSPLGDLPGRVGGVLREHAVRRRPDDPHRRSGQRLQPARLGLLLDLGRHHRGIGAGDVDQVH